MPRASNTPKRQQGAANHRDTRHENGLVGPGKRVQKQKSNGHINGNAKLEPAPPTAALPGGTPLLGHAQDDQRMLADPLRRPSNSAYSEGESSDYTTSAISVAQENHRRIDVNAAMNPSVHRDAGPLGFALTVLRSCPLYDTISILIVLLQIPPTFVSIVHILFATLTFVPPLTNGSSGLSWPDIFEGALGTPSVATIVSVDLVVLIIWIFLWSPLQDIFLDLAQSVIALTLGGGNPSGREASSKNNVLVCLSIIGVSRFARSRHLKPVGFKDFISNSISAHKFLGSTDLDDQLETTPQRHLSSAHIWIRNVLAVHILTQGVVRWVRDFLINTKRDSSSKDIGDPEAAKGILGTSGADAQASAHTDSEPSHSLPMSNLTASKKKRKLSAQVRIRQPLWAALASTKIVMVKEYETSHTAAESAGTNATDINNLGNAPFNTEADRVWVTHVGADTVRFNTSYFPHPLPEEHPVPSSEIDRSIPFFVKVNQTVWQAVRIDTIDEDAESADSNQTRFCGEVFGLAPTSSYDCEFFSSVNKEVIFSTSIRTLPRPTDIPDSALNSSCQPPNRPHSPTSGLKVSIASAEAQVLQERNRQRAQRKEQTRKLNAARKENDKINAQIASAGGNDDRLRQKIQQHNLQAKQADEAVASLTQEIEELSSSFSDNSEYNTAKILYQEQKSLHSKSQADFEKWKAAAEASSKALEAELSALDQKRDRLQARISKLSEQHERITNANAQGLDEAQRRYAERQAKADERRRLEEEHMQVIHIHAMSIEEWAIESQKMWHKLQAALQQQVVTNNSPTQMQLGTYADAPEGITRATTYASPWNPTPAYSLPSGMPPPGYGLPARKRRSSMLSTMSGFTESSGEFEMDGNKTCLGVVGREYFPMQTGQFGPVGERKGSGSQGSGIVNGIAGGASAKDLMV